MIKYVSGNILEATTDAIVNTVNCVGVMGKGLALQVKEQYPDVYDRYAIACKERRVRPGQMHVVHIDDAPFQMVVNFPTKRHWRDNSRMEDIVSGMKSLIENIKGLDIQSISIPPLGCANGGLNWADVRPVILKALEQIPDVDVHIYGEPEPSKTMTTVVSKHWGDIADDAEYIGRGSDWGNPFTHKDGTKAKFRVATREEAVAKYREWILQQPELLMRLHTLKGKQLVCYCKPAACHGDVLVDLIHNTFYLVIAGSRDFNDYALLKQEADRLTSKIKRRIVVVSGTARGADKLGERYAKEKGYEVARFPAEWDKHGKRAGMLRNADMASIPATIRGGAILFWDGVSPGTKGMAKICNDKGVQHRVIQF